MAFILPVGNGAAQCPFHEASDTASVVHFEQNVHVRHRLQNYGAGRRMDFDLATPDVIAGAIAEEIGRPTRYEPVETDGADRAAALIAELL
jgi:hypothetical protein